MKSFNFEVGVFKDHCEWEECTHSEYDTGYCEYGCTLFGNPYEFPCLGPDCPLTAKVTVELDD